MPPEDSLFVPGWIAIAEWYPQPAEKAVTNDDVRNSLDEVRPLIDHLRRETT